MIQDESLLKFEPNVKAEVTVGKKKITEFDDTEVYTLFDLDTSYIKIVSKSTKKEIIIELKK